MVLGEVVFKQSLRGGFLSDSVQKKLTPVHCLLPAHTVLTSPPPIIFAPYTFPHDEPKPVTVLDMIVSNKVKALLGLLFLVCTVQAQENLYGPDAPLDVAYVRAVHAAPGWEV